jgi:outer membrane murein-binding lipoprotein Lpp
MKKSVLMLFAAVGAAMLMTGCGKEKTEPSGAQSVGKTIEKKTDEVGKDLKKAADDTGKAIEKKTDEVGKDLKKAADDTGKAIEKKTDEAGKDLKNLGDKLKK